MSAKEKSIRAIALLSGGLDSTLALTLIRAQGIEVTALTFATGFGIGDHHQAMGEHAVRRGKSLLQTKLPFEIPVVTIDVAAEFLRVLAHPKHGYGSGVNPCIDCKIFMFRKAKAYMEEHGAQFVFTGEVLGQRPMSQHRRALDEIEEESGLRGYLLRPLSAKLLPPTIPEQRGWVDRERLYAINGRSRKEQVRLAAELGVKDYPQPAGGCFLTEKVFAERLRDLFVHEGKDRLHSEDLDLLKVGRHFRLSPEAKAVVGRNEWENGFLERFRGRRTFLRVTSHPGPTAIVEENAPSADQEKAARIAARYSDGAKDGPVSVHWERKGVEGELRVEPLTESEISTLRIGIS